MRKIILSTFICVLLFLLNENARAQCDLKIANLVITRTAGPTTNGPDCQYTFNAAFDIITNSGFKYLYFHSWRATDYVSSFDCSNTNAAQNPPTVSTLGTAVNTPGKSFLDIGFINLNNLNITTTPMNVTANIATTYQNDPTVNLITTTNSPGLTAMVNRKGTSDTLHFNVTNIMVLIPGGCSGALAVRTDIWGSNAASGTPKAQCYICGLLQTFNNPLIALTKNCNTAPFSYSLGLTTAAGGGDLHVVYKLYGDKNNDNVADPNDDDLLYTSGTILLPEGVTTNVANNTNLPGAYCCFDPWAQYGIFVIVNVQEFSNSVGTPVVNASCATLPIKLRSFNALRNRANVDVTWETEIEDNNKGFFIERKLSAGGWEDITFISSKGVNGNSNTPLTYSFVDLNDANGISQYRLRQVDIDGKFSYSLIRSVRGQGQKSKIIVYPNPSNDGTVNIVFDDFNGTRDVQVIDMGGRIVKQWKSITNNNLSIENLKTGVYTVRILNVETGKQDIEKFVVKTR